MARVKGKVAVVTGGASGIGRASAILLAEEGASVVITDINEEAGKELATELSNSGHQAIFVKHDVTKEEQWKSAMKTAIQTFGCINILLNNAGVAIAKTVEETTLDEWKWLNSINMEGVFLGTKTAIEQMKENGGGSIINLSSIEGIIGEPLAAAYNASKGGVRVFTKSAALHCAMYKYNIRVNSIHPGYIETNMVGGVVAEMKPEQIRDFQTRVIGSIPLGHLGEPMDIAYAVLYLASDESKYMTGSELVVDGGYTAH